jgi:hypothetical protein
MSFYLKLVSDGKGSVAVAPMALVTGLVPIRYVI